MSIPLASSGPREPEGAYSGVGVGVSRGECLLRRGLAKSFANGVPVVRVDPLNVLEGRYVRIDGAEREGSPHPAGVLWTDGPTLTRALLHKPSGENASGYLCARAVRALTCCCVRHG